jgi:hypothetical protein
VWPKALRLSRRYQDPYAGYAALMEAVAQSADQFDLIHCHSDWIHLPVLKRTGVPLVTTLHGRLDLPHVREVASKFPQRGIRFHFGQPTHSYSTFELVGNRAPRDAR